jgi:ribosomal protein L40E
MDSVKTFTMPLWGWVLIGSVLLSQAIWIYRDAAKRGENKFLWGFFGLLNCPESLLVYLLVTRYIVKHKICSACGKRIPGKAKFCPECGKSQNALQ